MQAQNVMYVSLDDATDSPTGPLVVGTAQKSIDILHSFTPAPELM